MQRLRFLEDSFENLSLRVKLELYLFPLILLFLIGYFLEEQSNTLQDVKPCKIEIANIKMSESHLDILKQIETYANKNDIKLLGIKNSEGKISLELEEELKKQLEFINYLESYNSFSKIDSFILEGRSLNLKVSFDKFYKKVALDLNEELKLFDTKDLHKSFTLNAIVGKSIFLNNRWLSIDDTIDSYTIKEIDSKGVVLSDGISNFRVDIYND